MFCIVGDDGVFGVVGVGLVSIIDEIVSVSHQAQNKRAGTTK